MTWFLGFIDGEGIYGTFLNYAFTVSMAGGALILFIYLWSKGRLDMDEEAKEQMMKFEAEEKTYDDT